MTGIFTSMHGARRGTRPAEESGDVHRAWGECTGRHNAGAGADERRRGLHRHGAGEGSLQSEDGGASAAHIRPGHSSPAGVEWGTAPGSGRAGCIHEGRGTSGRIHLWEDSSAEGNGIGRGHAGPGHQGFGSRDGMRMGAFPVPWARRGPLLRQRRSLASL